MVLVVPVNLFPQILLRISSNKKHIISTGTSDNSIHVHIFWSVIFLGYPTTGSQICPIVQVRYAAAAFL